MLALLFDHVYVLIALWLRMDTYARRHNGDERTSHVSCFMSTRTGCDSQADRAPQHHPVNRGPGRPQERHALPRYARACVILRTGLTFGVGLYWRPAYLERPNRRACTASPLILPKYTERKVFYFVCPSTCRRRKTSLTCMHSFSTDPRHTERKASCSFCPSTHLNTAFFLSLSLSPASAVFEKGDDVVMKLGDAGSQVKPLPKEVAWKYFRDLLNGMAYCMCFSFPFFCILMIDGRVERAPHGICETRPQSKSRPPTNEHTHLFALRCCPCSIQIIRIVPGLVCSMRLPSLRSCCLCTMWEVFSCSSLHSPADGMRMNRVGLGSASAPFPSLHST